MENIQLRGLLDRQAILDCIQQVSRGIDRMDADLVLSAFHDGAVDDHGAFVGHPVEFVKWVFDLVKTLTNTQHSITNHVCEIDGDSAHAETYYLSISTSAEGRIGITGGRYLDRLERRESRWGIVTRRAIEEWRGALSPTVWPVELVDALRSGGRPARDKSDLSYERPLSVRQEKVGYVWRPSAVPSSSEDGAPSTRV
jgi:hypothetical protein